MEKVKYTFLFCLGSFSVNMYVAQMSPLAPQIMEKFHISEMQYTSLYMSNLLPSLILGIPSAWLVRKFGLKKCQCIGVLITLFGLAVRLFDGYGRFYFGTLLLGAANIVISTMGAATFSALYRRENVGIALGCLIASGAAGKALAESTASLFSSFQALSFTDIALQIFVLLAWLLLAGQFEYGDERIPFSESFRKVISNSYLWIGALALMLVFGLYTGLSAHLPSILQGKGCAPVQAGAIAALISIGYFVGAVLIPKFASKILKKKKLMVALGLVSGSAAALTAWTTEKQIMAAGIFIIGICVGGLLPLAIAIPTIVLGFSVQESQVAGPVMTIFQLAGAVFIPTYVIVPMTGGMIGMFPVYAALFMVLESVLFALLPKNKNRTVVG